MRILSLSFDYNHYCTLFIQVIIGLAGGRALWLWLVGVVDVCTCPHKDNWRPLGKISSPIVGMCEGREGVLQTNYFLIHLLPENYAGSKTLKRRIRPQCLPQ